VRTRDRSQIRDKGLGNLKISLSLSLISWGARKLLTIKIGSYKTKKVKKQSVTSFLLRTKNLLHLYRKINLGLWKRKNSKLKNNPLIKVKVKIKMNQLKIQKIKRLKMLTLSYRKRWISSTINLSINSSEKLNWLMLFWRVKNLKIRQINRLFLFLNFSIQRMLINSINFP